MGRASVFLRRVMSLHENTRISETDSEQAVSSFWRDNEDLSPSQGIKSIWSGLSVCEPVQKDTSWYGEDGRSVRFRAFAYR